jgi:hypothetical protein
MDGKNLELFSNEIDLGGGADERAGCLSPIGRRAGRIRRRRRRAIRPGRQLTVALLLELRRTLEQQHAELMDALRHANL